MFFSKDFPGFVCVAVVAICAGSACFVSPARCQTQQANEQTQKQSAKDPLVDPLTDPAAQTQTKSKTNAAPTGQGQQRPTMQPKTSPQAPVKKQEIEIARPEDIILDTSDGVRLRVTYLAPPKAKGAEGPTNQAIPFILLHDWEGSRNDLAQYAFFLQRQGHAVIVPDLRGHGGSTEVVGRNQKIDAAKFRKNEVASAQKDIERCKKYLVQQHNKGEVNIDLLCVVAVGKTSVLAVQWTLNDWVAFPAFNTKGIKQGQDVKALMLVSPVKKLAGISILPTLKHGLFSGRGPTLPMLIVWGASEENARECESIYNTLKKSRPDVSDIENDNRRMAATTLFSVPIRKHQFSGKEMIERQRVDGFYAYVTNLMFGNKVIANAKNSSWTSRIPKKEDDDE